jgi:hypothetical protein
MDHAERIAKLVIEAVLPGAKVEFSNSQSDGEYDFELCYPNGSIAAVEVTSSVDRLQRETSVAIRKHGSIIQANECKKSWMIFPRKGARIITVTNKADEYLAKVEQAGLDTFRWLDACTARLQREAGLDKILPPPVPRCVEDICYDLGILSGSVISNGVTPTIFISHPGGHGAVGASVAIKAGERELQREDNRKKLGAAETAERHFVVYIGVMNGLPWIALTDFQPPTELPKLPNEITHIWLIGHSGKANSDEFVVWRAGTEEPWHSQRVVARQTMPYVAAS